MKSANQLPALLGRISSLGVGASFMRAAFPTWWEDEIADSPAGYQQACLYLSKAFNLDLASLVMGQPVFRSSATKFKLCKNIKASDVALSAHYASGVAEVALSAIEEQMQVPTDPVGLRNSCLMKSRVVDLPALLEWCVQAGIPTLYVSNLPGKKMTGQVVRHSGKFAIILSRKGLASEMLFWLAHEIGHIASGHLPEDGFVTDENIGSSENRDVEEKEADNYAIRLLNGEVANYTSRKFLAADRLAQEAQRLGAEKRVDAGHIALNLGYNMGAFPLAKAALKLLPNQNDPGRCVNETWFASVKDGLLTEDESEFLIRACRS